MRRAGRPGALRLITEVRLALFTCFILGVASKELGKDLPGPFEGASVA
jgi:hypothetical protein